MVQVIKYKCCGRVFAACREPNCYTDKDWAKNLRLHVKEGHRVEMKESNDFNFELCECNEEEKHNNENQLSLF